MEHVFSLHRASAICFKLHRDLSAFGEGLGTLFAEGWVDHALPLLPTQRSKHLQAGDRGGGHDVRRIFRVRLKESVAKWVAGEVDAPHG